MIRLEGLWQSIDARRRRQAFVVGLVISAGLLAFLVSFTSLAALWEALSRVEPAWLAATVIVMVLTYPVIAARLMLVLRLWDKAALYHTTDITVIHSLLLMVLPARLGDVCYPVLLRRSLGLNLTEAFVNLVALRFYDFLFSAALLLVALAGLRLESEDGALIAWATAAALIVAVIGVFIGRVVLRTVTRHGSAGTARAGLFDRLVQLAADMAKAVQAFGPREHAVLIVSTVLRWIFAAVLVYCLFRSVALDVGPLGALFVAMGLNLAVALPLQTVGGIGLVESAIAFLLGMLGVPVTAAVTTAVAMRIVWLLLFGACTAAWFAVRRVIEPAPHARKGDGD